jgi:hypothetical protein
MAQERERQPRGDRYPIVPPRVFPVRVSRQVALGDRLFQDTRLSHGDSRVFPNNFSIV